MDSRERRPIHGFDQAAAKRIPHPEDYDSYCDQYSMVVDYAGPKYISMKDSGSDPCGQNPAVTVTYFHGSTDELTRDVPKPDAYTNAELLGAGRGGLAIGCHAMWWRT